MIAVDTNILVYAHRADSPWNDVALQKLSLLVNGTKQWAVPWPCVHEFLSCVTHPKIYQPPTPLENALQALEVWFSSPQVNLLGEGLGYFEKLKKVTLRGKVKGPKIHDARIASICINHGVSELWTADRDFSAFPELKCSNPLVS